MLERLRQLAVTVAPDEIGIPEVPANSDTLTNVIELVFIAAGAMAVLFVMIGGLRYMISNGDSGQIQKAKDTIVYAAVGLVISVSAFVIIRFITGRI